MLRKITTEVFNGYSKLHKIKLISKGRTNRINIIPSSKEKTKEKRDNKTPLYSPKNKNKSIRQSVNNMTEQSSKKRIPIKRNSPKKVDINFSIETKRINYKKNEINNKSYLKEENKSKIK